MKERVSGGNLLGCLALITAGFSVLHAAQLAESNAVAARVYSVNYDIRLRLEGSQYHTSSRVRVRDGHTIPVLFKDYRLDVRVSGIDKNGYAVELRLFERTDGAAFTKPNSTYWQVNPAAIEANGRFNRPLQVHTYVADVELDFAIAVSEAAFETKAQSSTVE